MRPIPSGTIAAGMGVDRYSLDVREKHVSLFLDKQIPMATEFRGIINPLDVEEYKSRNGFQGSGTGPEEKMNPQQVVEEIMESGIRGRGGGGFPPGRNGRWWPNSPERYKIYYL